IDAFERKASPIFPIWYAPEKGLEHHDIVPTLPTSNTGVNPIDNAINTVMNPVNTGLGKVNQAGNEIQDVQDFLTRPYKDTPGGPFVDPAFGIQEAPPGTRIQRADELGTLAANAFALALKLKGAEAAKEPKDALPAFAVKVIEEISKVNADF